jgi:hypothetical protein
MEHLSSMTVKELKEYAKTNEIDLGGATTKAVILSTILDYEEASAKNANVIESKDPVKRDPVSSSGTNDETVIVSKAAERSVKKDTPTPKEDGSKVALHSEKNLHWLGVGNLRKGYNVVNKEAVSLWLTRRGVRKASAEEVATHYGK